MFHDTNKKCQNLLHRASPSKNIFSDYSLLFLLFIWLGGTADREIERSPTKEMRPHFLLMLAKYFLCSYSKLLSNVNDPKDHQNKFRFMEYLMGVPRKF